MAKSFCRQQRILLSSSTETDTLRKLDTLADHCFLRLLYELPARQIHIIFRDHWTDEDQALVEHYWNYSLFPLLAPIVSADTLPEPEHPFVRGVAAELRFEGKACLGWVSLPDTLPPFLSSSGKSARYIPVSEILLSKLDALFPGYEAIGAIVLEYFAHHVICIGSGTDYINQALQNFVVFHRQCPIDSSILLALSENPSFTEKDPSPHFLFRPREHVPLQRIFICPGQGDLPEPSFPILSKLSSQGIPVTIFACPEAASSMQSLEIEGCQIRCYPQTQLPSGGIFLAVYGRLRAEQFDLIVTTNDWSEKNSFLYRTEVSTLAMAGITFFQNLWIGKLGTLCSDTDLVGVIQKQTVLGSRGSIQLYSDELTDENLLLALADAAGAGVKIRILTAGLCRLMPVKPNVTIRLLAASNTKKGTLLCTGIGKKQQWYLASSLQQATHSSLCPIEDKDASQSFQKEFQALWTDAVRTMSASLHDLWE